MFGFGRMWIWIRSAKIARFHCYTCLERDKSVKL